MINLVTLLAIVVLLFWLIGGYFFLHSIFSSNNRSEHLGGSIVLFAISLIIVMLIGLVAPENEQEMREAASAGGFSGIEEYKDAKKLGLKTKTAYDEQIRVESERKEQQRLEEARKKSEADAKEAEKEKICRNDLQCFGDKHALNATFACKDVIVRLARYDAQWTDGFLEPKFPQFRWKNKADGILTYLGDKVKFQNAFGAWQHMTYECDYDPKLNTVVGARAEPSRM